MWSAYSSSGDFLGSFLDLENFMIVGCGFGGLVEKRINGVEWIDQRMY